MNSPNKALRVEQRRPGDATGRPRAEQPRSQQPIPRRRCGTDDIPASSPGHPETLQSTKDHRTGPVPLHRVTPSPEVPTSRNDRRPPGGRSRWAQEAGGLRGAPSGPERARVPGRKEEEPLCNINLFLLKQQSHDLASSL